MLPPSPGSADPQASRLSGSQALSGSARHSLSDSQPLSLSASQPPSLPASQLFSVLTPFEILKIQGFKKRSILVCELLISLNFLSKCSARGFDIDSKTSQPLSLSAAQPLSPYRHPDGSDGSYAFFLRTLFEHPIVFKTRARSKATDLLTVSFLSSDPAGNAKGDHR